MVKVIARDIAIDSRSWKLRALWVALFWVLASLLVLCLATQARGDVGDPPDSAVIQVRPIVEVDGTSPDIRLGDLIVARGLDASAIETLRAVRLADTPKPGESRAFAGAGLEPLFRQPLKDLEASRGIVTTLRIPQRVTVTRKTFRLRKEDIEIELLNELRAICSDCRFEISQLAIPLLPTNLSPESSWKLRLRSDLPKGSFSIPMEINEGENSKTYWITGSVATRRRVPIAKRAMGFGERVRPEDYSMEWKDVTFSNDTAAGEVELAGSVTARQLAAGQIFWNGVIRRELAIKTGDPVKVSAGTEDWTITIDGISQSQGHLGDLIRVKIPRTQKTISGMLTNKGIVEVRSE